MEAKYLRVINTSNGVEYVQFNNAEKKFLAKYTTESDLFTSVAEMNSVINTFNLNQLSSRELRATRNSVVKYYSNRIQLDKNDYEASNHWMNSMQSVTAVIDNVLVKKYGMI